MEESISETRGGGGGGGGTGLCILRYSLNGNKMLV